MVKIKLIEDWKAVIHRSWANRLVLLSLLVTGAEQALPLLSSIPAEFRHIIPAWLPMLLMGLSVYARVVRQQALSGGK